MVSRFEMPSGAVFTVVVMDCLGMKEDQLLSSKEDIHRQS
jgi:hypothetical protein